ncbi:hypothetical protein [Streptomyces sp. NRRL WC-3742]|uniref:hypothetical protein n=1 Tax=Streptomyces sp. NRRL WC-3742 TaxID=1463934 RepID=UPI0004C711EF|nr:hypothetical protein [Streptomyces sp. NRRL WC-3742]
MTTIDRTSQAYAAIESLERQQARARRAAEQDPGPETAAALARAEEELRAGLLACDRAEHTAT